MAKRGSGKGNERPVIIKRVTGGGGDGHHGGAWKIAYADFVTAMMAFFLLMWLINATTDAQRRGIADYFAPSSLTSRGPSGAGQPFGGRSLFSDGPLVADAPLVPTLVNAPKGPDADEEDEEGEPRVAAARRAVQPPAVAAPTAPPPTDDTPPGEAARRETLARVTEEIRQSIRADPALATLARQILVEEVPEGLRVQLVDAEGQPVFQTGQASPNERGRALLARVAGVLATQPHPVEITGHTDATPFRGGGDRSNWDLSAERAVATRRILIQSGVAEARIQGVAGRADREPLVADRPLDAANRRVAVLMLLPAQGNAR